MAKLVSTDIPYEIYGDISNSNLEYLYGMRPIQQSQFNEIRFNRKLGAYDIIFTGYNFIIVDESKFALFVLKHSEYIIKIYSFDFVMPDYWYSYH